MIRPITVPLGTINGRMPDYPHTDELQYCRHVNITSDNHLTGAFHTDHFIPASTRSGSLSCMGLVTLLITDIGKFQFIAIIIQTDTCFGNW